MILFSTVLEYILFYVKIELEEINEPARESMCFIHSNLWGAFIITTNPETQQTPQTPLSLQSCSHKASGL